MAEARARRGVVEKRMTVPGNLAVACEQFNSGRYWDCHETLEEIWQEEVGEVRDLYKGLIQLAAGFVHVGRNNYVGAERLLRTGRAYLEPFRDPVRGAMGFDVDAILRQAEAAYAAVLIAGRGRLDELPASIAPVYACDLDALPAEVRRRGAWGFDAEGRALEMTIEVYE